MLSYEGPEQLYANWAKTLSKSQGGKASGEVMDFSYTMLGAPYYPEGGMQYWLAPFRGTQKEDDFENKDFDKIPQPFI
jgi:hypothetical protein